MSTNLENENLVQHLVRIIEFALAGTTPHEEVIKALNSLIQFERSRVNSYPRRLGNILLPFFKKYPMEALDACSMQDSDGGYGTALRILAVRHDRQGDSAVSVVPEDTLLDWCKLSLNERCIFAAQACKFMEISNPDGHGDESALGISNISKSVLSHAPDKRKVLEIFINRLQPNSWSGSLSLIMRQKLLLLDHLNPNKEEEIQTLIENAKERFSRRIEREEQEEQNRERSRTASFE